MWAPRWPHEPCYLGNIWAFNFNAVERHCDLYWKLRCWFLTLMYQRCRNGANDWYCLWWLLQMETFSALLALCAGNTPVNGKFPSQRPVTRSFEVFFDLRLNKLLSKQSRRRWFETPSHSLWSHCNARDCPALAFNIHVITWDWTFDVCVNPLLWKYWCHFHPKL